MNNNNFYIYWQDSGLLLWSRHGDKPASGLLERQSIAAQVGDDPLVIVLPCQHISLYEVALSARSDRHIQASLPYALEDDLASDIECNHFAYRRTGQGVYAAAVLHEQIETWLQQIQALGLQPKVLLPEACLLPADTDSLILHDDGFFMQFAGLPMETLAGGLDMLPTWLQFHLKQESESGRTSLLVWDLRRTERSPIAALQAIKDRELLYHGVGGSAEQTFADLLNGHQKKLEINLLQGQYDNSGNFLRELWQSYRYVAYLTVAIFLFGSISMWLRAGALEKQYRQLNQQAEQTYRATFPDAKHVEDPKIQMQQQLKRIQDNAAARANDFVAMLASVGNVLQRYGKGKIDRMTFQQGKLRIDLVVGSQQDIEQIAGQLDQLPEVEVNRGRVQQQDNLFRTNIEMVVKPQ